MKTLVIYDSVYGNTEQIARTIGGAIAGEVQGLRAGEANPSEVQGVDLLLVGAPTQGGRPTPAARDFLDQIPAQALNGVRVAAFDTRIPAKWAAIFGYAARGIARRLKKKGRTLVAPPEGFFVSGAEGSLLDGELERAANWAKEISARELKIISRNRGPRWVGPGTSDAPPASIIYDAGYAGLDLAIRKGLR